MLMNQKNDHFFFSLIFLSFVQYAFELQWNRFGFIPSMVFPSVLFAHTYAAAYK